MNSCATFCVLDHTWGFLSEVRVRSPKITDLLKVLLAFGMSYVIVESKSLDRHRAATRCICKDFAAFMVCNGLLVVLDGGGEIETGIETVQSSSRTRGV